jgi:hypothetical protein
VKPLQELVGFVGADLSLEILGERSPESSHLRDSSNVALLVLADDCRKVYLETDEGGIVSELVQCSGRLWLARIRFAHRLGVEAELDDSRVALARWSSATVELNPVVKLPFRRHATNHAFRNLVRVALQGIARLANAPSLCNPATLLDHMGRLVGRGEQIRRAREPDPFATGESECTQRLTGFVRLTSDRGFHRTQIVMPEAALDVVEMGQLRDCVCDTQLRRFLRTREGPAEEVCHCAVAYRVLESKEEGSRGRSGEDFLSSTGPQVRFCLRFGPLHSRNHRLALCSSGSPGWLTVSLA